MKNSLIVIIIIVAAIIGFLVGYSVAPRTDTQATATAAGGHGAPSGGYGHAPAAGGYGAAPSGGYGH